MGSSDMDSVMAMLTGIYRVKFKEGDQRSPRGQSIA